MEDGASKKWWPLTASTASTKGSSPPGRPSAGASAPASSPSYPRSPYRVWKAIYRLLILAILVVVLALAIVSVMRLSNLLSASSALLAARSTSAAPANFGPGVAWHADQFKNFVVFGDSYTDESRLNYFINHNFTAPPAGTVLPESYGTSTGGRLWARYVVQYTGHNDANGSWDPSMSLYNYAVSGAVCSNQLSPRSIGSDGNLFPDVLGYELPAFQADMKAGKDPATGKATFTPPLSPYNTVYTIYIGTNDLGADAFFTDSQVPGKAIPDYIDCVYSVLEELYKGGARYFVINNVVPLDLAPLYANASEGGIDKAAAMGYWPTGKGDNLTAIAEQMREYTSLVNQVYQYRTPFEALLGGKFLGAKFALFDVHKLFFNIHQNPSQYLNGSAPANSTSSITSTTPKSNSPDSFLWYDSLHPSEQTDRVMAREFVNVLNGNSSYATYWGI